MDIPRLQKTIRKNQYDIKIDTAFNTVIKTCAELTNTRQDTWINDQIIDVFCRLHGMGHAHSIEVWDDCNLIGGLYGLKIGSAFFGESMFSRKQDASKIALVHLAARLWAGGFTILDTQFINPHLEQFGAYEISHDDYLVQLESALQKKSDFLQTGYNQHEICNAYLTHNNQNGHNHSLGSKGNNKSCK